jgi:hypothetical protein
MVTEKDSNHRNRLVFEASEDQSYKWWYVLALFIAACAVIWLYSIINNHRRIRKAKTQELHREHVRNEQQRMQNEALQQLQSIQKVNLPGDNGQKLISRTVQPENSIQKPPKVPSTAKFEERKRENVEKSGFQLLLQPLQPQSLISVDSKSIFMVTGLRSMKTIRTSRSRIARERGPNTFSTSAAKASK